MAASSRHDRTDAPDAARLLRPGETCQRTAHADRFGVIVDAGDYFAAAREAMLEAEDVILLVGWDFDLRIDLVPGEVPGDAPNELGPFLKHLVQRKPRLRILILKWDMSVLFTGNQILPIVALDLRAVERVRLRFDSKHPWTAAHHQKIVVIDDSLAFCGGIDMTTDRWDSRRHLPHDDRRRRPDGSRAGPWHDATAVVDGAAAQALGELARDRWRRATGRRLPASKAYRPIWPSGVEPQFRDVEVGIARTMPAYEDRPAIHEVERLYIEAIRSARRTIYLESQYFASASICEALEARLREPDGPEVVVVNPLSTAGWLEQRTMGATRDLRLASIERADAHGRFGIYHPVNAAGEPIYVHAKILIVDDRLLRVGSSNVSNRSMGFDTECDLAIEGRKADDREAILSLRDDLLAEHLDTSVAEVRRAIERSGSLLGAVESLRRAEGHSLQKIFRREMTAAEEAVARSHLANPERPADPEARLEHLAKRLFFSVSPETWLGLSAAAILTAGYLWRRRRRKAGARWRGPNTP